MWIAIHELWFWCFCKRWAHVLLLLRLVPSSPIWDVFFHIHEFVFNWFLIANVLFHLGCYNRQYCRLGLLNKYLCLTVLEAGKSKCQQIWCLVRPHFRFIKSFPEKYLSQGLFCQFCPSTECLSPDLYPRLFSECVEGHWLMTSSL